MRCATPSSRCITSTDAASGGCCARAAELRDTLSGTFGLTLANAAGLDALLTRLTAVAA